MIRRICLIVTFMFCGTTSMAAVAQPLGYLATLTQAAGSGPDYLLQPTAIKNAVLKGLRDSGLQVNEELQAGGLAVQFDGSTLFEPQLQRLRVVSGHLELHALSVNADTSRIDIKCSRKIFIWRAAGVEAEMAQHIKDSLYQEAKSFAQDCRTQLNK